MKAIILVALVASVAARGVDIDTLRLLKEKSLLTRPVVDDVLLKEKELTHRLPLEKNVIVGQDLINVDTPVNYINNRDVYDYDYDRVDRVLSIDELYQTELFRQYLAIPLFRQYIQYPSFQRYIASQYFQKFWQIQSFRQYFYNPILFYKYIVPLVQLFHSEYNLPTNYNYNIYGQDVYNKYNTYGQDVYNKYNTYDQDVLGYKNLVDDVIYKRNVLPYSDVYNRYSTYGQQYPISRAGQYLPYALNTPVNHKYILDKIYKTLFVNQPTVGDLTQVKTDVKIVPGEKKFVVEPITGERHLVDESKIVDVKVDQKIIPVEKIVDTVVPEVVDTVLPEHLQYLNERELVILKELLKEKIITPEIYEAVIRGQIHFSTLLRQYLGRHIVNTDIYNRDQLINNRDVEIVDLLKQLPIYNRQYVGNDRLVNLINKLYNNEYPVQHRGIFDNTYNRFDRFNPIVA